jgi:hypothetical protein
MQLQQQAVGRKLLESPNGWIGKPVSRINSNITRKGERKNVR